MDAVKLKRSDVYLFLTMLDDKGVVADLTKREDLAQVLPHAPILSSQKALWNGMFFIHYHHPAHESPEHQWTQHLIGITGAKSPVKSEHRLGERLLGD